MQLTTTGLGEVGDPVADLPEAPEDTVWEVETDPADEGAAAVEDNSHAGQGSVVLDIGGDVGALVLHAPAALEGVEIEIRPIGGTPYPDGHAAGSDHPHADDHVHDPHERGHSHGHDPVHSHGHDHPHDDDHGDAHDHDHDGGHRVGGVERGHKLIHVAVLRRPSAGGALYAAVYPSLHEGTYELYRRPAEPVAMTVAITGAQVAEAHWPDGA